ncbi:hypothetical protein ISF_08289 [Cordyceps fumosorosea ARSEF 2679]|uniref:Uncharacterized protein n=1 Tax=Cordyceps fumosorosea (strain ARSEF 2679) TaxID=1081104 RepID=A0A167MRX4_CORFA|nr:hypothetical protein ISF_08289 [Cordyceps fumosorosea ARSEF 2679]OAA54688.1 hypothetical protein ISF_08289 [Cordyceps fumosorosea ARSEF 2679]
MKPSATIWAAAGSIGAAAAQSVSDNPSPTTAASAPSCTATLLTKLCDYPSPGPEFAVASSGREFCWGYCQRSALPCSFIVFAAGNPYTGSGTCWVYPGQAFDASKGASGSSCANPYLSVYDKPTCAGGGGGGGGTSPADRVPAGCSAAVASPSPLAALCDYPTPPNDCRDSCAASAGAPDCLAQCAMRADGCAYAVFRAGSSSKSPYASGTCWMYPEGSYDGAAGKACGDGVAPQLYVYNNTCPRPSPTAPKTSASATASSAAGKGQSGGGSGTADSVAATTSHNSAPTARALSHGIVMGAAALAWNAL